MPRYKDYSYEQTKMIALSFQNQILPGSFEFAMNHIVDESIDLSVFKSRYHNDETGAPAFDPAILLKIVLYAYSRGITSSRLISRACEENIIFMALSADTHPHFTTIADFISTMQEQIAPIFRDVLSLCYAEGLIGKTMFAIDGCKLSSNCSKEWSGTKADFEKKRRKIEKSIRYILNKHRQADIIPESKEELEAEKKAVRNLRHRLCRITKWLSENDDKIGARGKPRQSNLVDNESAKMPTSHGVVQGYTGTAAVDAKRQVIIHAEAFGVNQEKELLQPVLQGVRKNCRETNIGKTLLRDAKVLADTGYHSEENMKYVFDKKIDAYVADTQFRKRDERFSGFLAHRKSPGRNKAKYYHKQFHAADFNLDKKGKTLTCPAGCKLKLSNPRFRNTSGLIGSQYKAEMEDCRQCAYRDKCLSGKKLAARSVTLFRERAADTPVNYTQRMIAKIDSPAGRKIYGRRMAIVEPVFGNITRTMGLDRFTLRGGEKVDTQWKIFSIVHNIWKICRYGFSYGR